MSASSRELARKLTRHATGAAAHLDRPLLMAQVIVPSPISAELMFSRGVLDEDNMTLTQWVKSYAYQYGLAVGDNLLVMQLPSDDWVAYDVISVTEVRAGLSASGATASSLSGHTVTRKIPFYGPDGEVLAWVPAYEAIT